MTTWRTAVPAMGLIAAALVFGVSAPARSASEGADISGTWRLTNGGKANAFGLPARERIPLTAEGTVPPLNPEAKKLYEQRMADADAGRPYAAAFADCLTGMPIMMQGPLQIVQSPGQVTMLFQLWHVFRTIRLNQKHPADLDPGLIGDSVGHWEGDTLVVDTTGMNDRTSFDPTGMPHSDAMRLTERIRRLDKDKLEDLITIDDPKTFTKPWVQSRQYRLTTEPMDEFLCESNHNGSDAQGRTSFR